MQPRELTTRVQVDEVVGDLHKALQTAIEKAVPWRRPSTKSQAWWTKECSTTVAQARLLRRTGIEEEYAIAKAAKRTTIQWAKVVYFRVVIHKASQSLDKV
jgi:hypothetical protein